MTKLSELMVGIRNFDLVLPEFQREYVWNKDQAKELLVSLFRDYPTGSLLFWRTTTPPELKNTKLAVDKIGSTQVILDGQQRMTTLYLLTQGDIPPYYTAADLLTDPRDLYFNLESGDFQYYRATQMQNSPVWVKVSDSFAKTPQPIMIAMMKGGKPEMQMQAAQQYSTHLTRLQNILERDYPIQVVPQNASIDDAIDVFDRVNRLGTKLTEAELALTHVTGKWPKARQEMKKEIEALAKKGFRFDLTFMIRTLVGVVHKRSLYETIHRTEQEPILTGWGTLKSVLEHLCNILPGHAYIHSTDDLSSTNVLVPVVVYLAKNGGMFPNDKEMRLCIHWLYAASLWARYSSQTDQKLDHDISIIQRTDSPWAELVNTIIEARGRLIVQPSDLEGSGIQNPIYRMAFIMAKRRGAVDWHTGAPLSSISGDIKNRYIFPQNVLQNGGQYDADNRLDRTRANEIANRAFLTADVFAPLAYTAPAQYLPHIEEKYPNALIKQFVPNKPDLWSVERFNDFLVERRRLIANAINAEMQALLLETGDPPNVTLEELLAGGESPIVEFKSSLRYDLHQQKFVDERKLDIAKAIVALMNAQGGTLLIGVADNGTILGIEHDFQPKPTVVGLHEADTYQLMFTTLLKDYIGLAFGHFAHLRFAQKDGHTVAVVEVEQSTQPVFVKANGKEIFYLRNGTQSSTLDGQAMITYIGMRWQT